MIKEKLYSVYEFYFGDEMLYFILMKHPHLYAIFRQNGTQHTAFASSEMINGIRLHPFGHNISDYEKRATYIGNMYDDDLEYIKDMLMVTNI